MGSRWNGKSMTSGDLRRRIINIAKPKPKKKKKVSKRCKKSSSEPSQTN